jgi:hypothetical protein
MSYLGNNPQQDITFNNKEYIATAGQTTFNCVYTDYVEVFVNGVRLANTDFTATNGMIVVLNTGLLAGDSVSINGFINLGTININSTAITNAEFTATVGQTVFNTTYTPTYMDILRNGIELTSSDFTAVNGTSFTLTVGANDGDIIVAKKYNIFQVADVYTKAEVNGLITSSQPIDEVVSHLAVTTNTVDGSGNLTSVTYTTGNKEILTYVSNVLTTVEYTDIDGTTVLLTITYGLINGLLTPTGRV